MPVAFEAGQAHSLAIDGLKLHARSYGGNVGTPALMSHRRIRQVSELRPMMVSFKYVAFGFVFKFFKI